MNTSVQMARSSQWGSNTLRRAASRVGTGVFIGVAHAALTLFLLRDSVQSQSRHAAVEPLLVDILEPQRPQTPGLSFQPEEAPRDVRLVVPELPANDLPTTAALDPPKIDPSFAPDMARFTERANLPFGQSVTVLLLLDIAADGSVITARVARSSGNDDANTAAIEYAYTTRWIPGTVDGEPRTMQAALTVVLGELA